MGQCVLHPVSCLCVFFFFQAEDGIRDAQESRGLGDVYKRQAPVGAGGDHQFAFGVDEDALAEDAARGEGAGVVGLSLIHI